MGYGRFSCQKCNNRLGIPEIVWSLKLTLKPRFDIKAAVYMGIFSPG